MSSRAMKMSELVSADMTPYEKSQLFINLAASEGYEGHDAAIPSLLHLDSATVSPTPSNPHNSSNVFSFTVPASLCNMGGNLHGGAVALIFDVTTSAAITAASKEGFWDTGHVSRTLNCTYLKPIAKGKKVVVESWVVNLGKRMGLTRAEMRDENGRVCYTCEHGKASVGGSSI